eukprot:332460_1
MSDFVNNAVAIETYSSNEVAQYVLKQSYYHPADEIRKRAIDGLAYSVHCIGDTLYFMELLTQSCGFSVYAARLLMETINKYPRTTAPPQTRNEAYLDNEMDDIILSMNAEEIQALQKILYSTHDPERKHSALSGPSLVRAETRKMNDEVIAILMNHHKMLNLFQISDLSPW